MCKQKSSVSIEYRIIFKFRHFFKRISIVTSVEGFIRCGSGFIRFRFFFRRADLARKITQITRIDELLGRSERSEFQFRSSNSVYQLYLFLEWILHIIVSELRQIRMQSLRRRVTNVYSFFP